MNIENTVEIEWLVPQHEITGNSRRGRSNAAKRYYIQSRPAPPTDEHCGEDGLWEWDRLRLEWGEMGLEYGPYHTLDETRAVLRHLVKAYEGFDTILYVDLR